MNVQKCQVAINFWTKTTYRQHKNYIHRRHFLLFSPKADTQVYHCMEGRRLSPCGGWLHTEMVKVRKVKTSICIARLMHQAPLTRIYVTETDPPDRYLGHRPACKHSPGQWPNNRHRQRQPASNRPWRDGWLSWPCWSTDSGGFTHKVVTRLAISLVQDRESSPARTGGLTTMLRHQLAVKVYSCPSILCWWDQCITSKPSCQLLHLCVFMKHAWPVMTVQQWRSVWVVVTVKLKPLARLVKYTHIRPCPSLPSFPPMLHLHASYCNITISVVTHHITYTTLPLPNTSMQIGLALKLAWVLTVAKGLVDAMVVLVKLLFHKL